MTAVLVLLVAVLGTLVGSILLLRLPGPVARPVPDRWHRKSTPLTGGFALLAGFLLALGSAALAGQLDRRFGYVALAASAALALGLGDDERWIGPRTKFAGQLAIAGATAAVIRPGWLPLGAAVPVAAFVLVASMNSFNFLDNIDGLAAGTGAIAAGTLAVTTLFVGGPALRMLACAGAGACLGFLPFNYRPRRPAALFMGDSGSHCLGLVIGATALIATPAGASDVSAAVVAPLLILALPILDTSLVILVRLAEGRPIWRGGLDHLSHRLVYVGLGERQAVAALLALAASCAGAAVLVVAVDDALVTGVAGGAVFAVLVGLGSRLVLVSEASRVAVLPVRPERAIEAQPEPQPEHAHAG
jgi:UDP-N-acetylmuramyl pentapeptide phosphotransferase/UDP-N-acetylglucosamine-1-phosphate transferase